MWNHAAKVFLLALIPLSAVAGPKERGSTNFQVFTVRTQIHRSTRSMFTYTNLIFAQVNGRKLVYECAERGDLCPVMESGKTYSGAQDGTFLYVPMSFPDEQKDLAVKFKRVGSW